MNLLEAIAAADGNWFRVKNTTYDYGLSFNKFGDLMIHQVVGGKILSRPYNLSFLLEFTGEWELVTPDQLMAGSK